MDRQRRVVIGRAMMVSGLVLLLLAAFFWWEIVPVAPEAKTLVTGVLLVAAVADVLVGLFYFRG